MSEGVVISTGGGLPADLSALARLTGSQRSEVVALLDEINRRSRMLALRSMFPDGGPYARHMYPKHLEFFRAGAKYRERVFMAGNRVGKTMGAGTEWTYHLTGEYPDWWEGHRFNRPIRLMVSGDTHETTRDILQVKLLGATLDHKEDLGTGLIPGKAILGYTPRSHVPGAIEKVRIANKFGGASELLFRSYVQGRVIFQGTELDGFWPDEECPQDVYEEGLVRLMTKRGLATLTFTPLEGLTELIQQLDVPPDELEKANRYIVRCGWDDVPHLTKEMKDEMFAKLPPHQRDARTHGVPRLGSGAIYPVIEEDIIVPDFVLPAHWKRGYGLDVGWNRTAASFLAYNQDTDTHYLYAEHYRGQTEPAVHAQAIQARGRWMQGAIDPAARGRGQDGGMALLMQYQGLGLNLTLANNAVEAGIYEVWSRMSTGRLKVFKSCVNHLAEYRIYRRDDKGQIVKKNDHAMDSMRYGVNTPACLSHMPAAANQYGIDNLQRRMALAGGAAHDPGMGY
jgi:phage terminase large subunit-like protein